MRIIAFEIRKNILRKPVIIPMILLLLINIFAVLYQSSHVQDIFSDEVDINQLTEKEYVYYQELHKEFDGNITKEKQQELISLHNNLEEIINEGSYTKEYTNEAKTGYIFGDYYLVHKGFYTPMEYMVSYYSINNDMVEKANDNILFYEKTNNKYEIDKNKYIVNNYKNRCISDFYDVSGWKNLFSYNFSDVLLIIALMLLTLPMFYQERTNGMEKIVKGTIKGCKTYTFGKICSVVIGISVFTVLLMLCNYIVFNCVYGLCDGNMPIYALDCYKYTPFNITLNEAYLAITGMKLVAMIVISIIFTFIAYISKNPIITFIGFVGVVCLGLYCSGYIYCEDIFKSLLAIISPFSLLKFSDIIKEFNEINLIGHFDLKILCCIKIQVIFGIVMFCFVSGMSKIRKHKIESTGENYVTK